MFNWFRRASGPVSRISARGREAAFVRAEAALRAADAGSARAALQPLLDDAVPHARAHLLAAAAARMQGDRTDVARQLAAAVRADPALTEAWRELAALRAGLGDWSGCAEALRGLLAQRPDDVASLAQILPALESAGDTAGVAATSRIHRLLDLRFDASRNPAAAQHAQGRLDEAVVVLRKAVSLAPTDAVLWAHLGCTRLAQGHHDTAIACLRDAIRRSPVCVDAHRWLAAALEEGGDAESALPHYRAVATLAEHDVQAWSAYCAARLRQGERPSDRPRAGGTRAPHQAVARPETHTHERLRIGYVCSDFGDLDTTARLEPVFERHDRDRFEIYGYDRSIGPGDAVSRLRSRCDHWRPAAMWRPEELEAKVRADGIDILVDLSGPAPRGHLALFMRRPSSVQVAWSGTDPSALPACFDAHLCDDAALCRRGDALPGARLVSLGPAAFCVRPGDDRIAGTTTGSGQARPPTFGCLPPFRAVSPSMQTAIANILARVTDARCVFSGVPHGNAAARLADVLSGHGVDPSRVVIDEDGSAARRACLLRDVDILLDSFPESDPQRALQALSLGVPVVALAGDRDFGGGAAAILRGIGLDDWVCHDQPAFEALACALAAETASFSGVREPLRAAVTRSPWRDEAGFVARLERAYRQLWEDRDTRASSLEPIADERCSDG